MDGAAESIGRLARLRMIFGSRIAQLMVTFFTVETIGTFLGPSLIDSVPLFVLAISPGDHHIALARETAWIAVFAVALLARIVKYEFTFRLAGDGLDEMRRVGLHRAARVVDGRLARRSWAFSVFFLPGMWAAMLCASQQISALRYRVWMVASTAVWVGSSVAAAEALDEQLSRVSNAITSNSVEATGAIVAVFAAIGLYRFVRLDRGDPLPLAQPQDT